MEKRKTALTGIKPTGPPHLGNYLGMIRPALDLVDRYRAFFFIADYHALTTTPDPPDLHHRIHQAAAAWLALGLPPDRVVFYRQSAVPQTFELAWILSCWTAKGLLNRAHAYKSAAAVNIEEGHPADHGINAGLYLYPVLMAADILLMGADVVPVGQDQRQHIEIARDVAAGFHAAHKKTFRLPEALVHEETMTVPGIDGRKMSKSYRNTIPIFDAPDRIRKQVMRITTDSRRPEEPKDPETCNVFGIYRHFAPPAAVAEKRRLYREGGLAYGEIKAELADILIARFGERRCRYDELMDRPEIIDGILEQGAAEARDVAGETLARVRGRVGVS
jgi:tryptophanyl-tRNA synthetase